MRRAGRYRRLVWIPRGPLGLALFVALVALLLMLVIAASAIVLAGAVIAGLALSAYGAGRALLGAGRGNGRRLPDVKGHFADARGRPGLLGRVDGLLDTIAGQRPRRAKRSEPPLQRYVSCVEKYDHLTSRALALDLQPAGSWLGERRLQGLLESATELCADVTEVERALSADPSAELARPGLWELIVAATELQHYLCDLCEFPYGRGRGAQLRELASLSERRAGIDQRRNDLVRRLQATDLRPHAPDPA